MATEALANAVYREMGARVAPAGIVQHEGKPALAYPAVQGEVRPHVFQGKRGPSTRLGKHFVTDALVANWDMAGLEDDNILWDPEGHPVRLDQGGTFEFRAMGEQKDYGPVPKELESLLRPGRQGQRAARVSEPDLKRQAAEVAMKLTPERVDALVDAAPFRDAQMRERVRTNLKARVRWLGRWARGQEHMALPLPKPRPVLTEREAFWLTPLEEAASYTFHWDEHLHPRDLHGQFINTIAGLKGTASIKLDGKTSVKRDKDGTWRVVRSGQIVKGFRSPGDAARAALDRSAKSKDADSVGALLGSGSHKDFNAYLEAHPQIASGTVRSGGSGVNDTLYFSGQELTVHQAQDELAALKNRQDAVGGQIVASLASGSKEHVYLKRSQPTLVARRKELEAKIEAVGGTTNVGPIAAAPYPPQDGGPEWAQSAVQVKNVLEDYPPGTKVNFKDTDPKDYVVVSGWKLGPGGYQVTIAGDAGPKAGVPIGVPAFAFVGAKNHETQKPAASVAKPPPIAHADLVTGVKQGLAVTPENGDTAQSLGAGHVIQTPGGKVGVVQSSTTWPAGKVLVRNIETGEPFTVAGTAVPPKATAAPSIKSLAVEALKVKGSAVSAPGPAKPPEADADWGHLPTENTAEMKLRQHQQGLQLTSDQEGAIKAYTGSYYSSINKQLRVKEGPVGDLSTEEWIAKLDDVFRAGEGIPEDMVLWRGVSGSTGKAYKQDAQVGSVIRDNGYMSSSVSESTAKGWGSTILKMRLPKGTKGLYVGPGTGLSSHSGEQEMIIQRGVSFKVVGRREMSGAYTVLIVEPITGHR